jgi:hypothetical protein
MSWLQSHLASAERRFADAHARLARRLALQQKFAEIGHTDRALAMRSEIAALRQEIVYREAILATVQACVRRRMSGLVGKSIPPMSTEEMLSPLRVEVVTEPMDQVLTPAV